MSKNFEEIKESVGEYSNVIDATKNEKKQIVSFLEDAAKKISNNKDKNTAQYGKMLSDAAESIDVLWDTATVSVLNEDDAKPYIDNLAKFSNAIQLNGDAKKAVWNAIADTPTALDKMQMLDDLTVVGKVLGFTILSKTLFDLDKKKYINNPEKFTMSGKYKSSFGDFEVYDLDNDGNVVQNEQKEKVQSKFVLEENKPAPKKEEPKQVQKEEPKQVQKEEPKQVQKEEIQYEEELPTEEEIYAVNNKNSQPQFDSYTGSGGIYDNPDASTMYSNGWKDTMFTANYEDGNLTYSETQDIYGKQRPVHKPSDENIEYENINAYDLPEEDEPEVNKIIEENKIEEPKKEEPKKEEPKKEEPKKKEPKNAYEKALTSKKPTLAHQMQEGISLIQNSVKFGEHFIKNNLQWVVGADPLVVQASGNKDMGVAGTVRTWNKVHKMIVIGEEATRSSWDDTYYTENTTEALANGRFQNKEINEIHASLKFSDYSKIAENPDYLREYCADYHKEHKVRSEEEYKYDQEFVKKLKDMKKEIAGGMTDGTSEATYQMLEKMQNVIDYLGRPREARFSDELRNQKLTELGLSADNYIVHKKSQAKNQTKANLPDWQPSGGIDKIRYKDAKMLKSYVTAYEGVDLSQPKEAPKVKDVKIKTDRYEWLDQLNAAKPEDGPESVKKFSNTLVTLATGMLAAELVGQMPEKEQHEYLFKPDKFSELQKKVYASKTFTDMAKKIAKDVSKNHLKPVMEFKDKLTKNNGEDFIKDFKKELVKNKEKQLPGTEQLFPQKKASKNIKK